MTDRSRSWRDGREMRTEPSLAAEDTAPAQDLQPNTVGQMRYHIQHFTNITVVKPNSTGVEQ